MNKLILVATLALGGCATVQEREMYLDAQEHAECVRYGIDRNHPGYANCRFMIAENRKAQERAASAVANAEVAGALSGAAAGIILRGVR